MSYLVVNPEDRFSCDEAHTTCKILVMIVADLIVHFVMHLPHCIFLEQPYIGLYYMSHVMRKPVSGFLTR